MTLTLGFDSSAAHCAAALLKDGVVIARRSEGMSRGQAERLMPLLEELLSAQGVGWSDLTRIGVGTGPGNFTGIRIAVAAARGLALSLGIPALGVTTFEAIRMDAQGAAAVPAPQGLYHVEGQVGQIRTVAMESLNGATLPPEPAELAARIARLAAVKIPGARPAPLYLRPADAGTRPRCAAHDPDVTAAELAAISARAYIHMHPWAEADFTDCLAHPTSLLAPGNGAFALGRVIVDEAEILALATDPAQQRAGQGRAVLAAFERLARQRGAVQVFLEVAASNAPACAFYLAQGYAQTGRRRGYYATPGGGRDDALLMSKALT